MQDFLVQFFENGRIPDAQLEHSAKMRIQKEIFERLRKFIFTFQKRNKVLKIAISTLQKYEIKRFVKIEFP